MASSTVMRGNFWPKSKDSPWYSMMVVPLTASAMPCNIASVVSIQSV